MTVIFFIFLLLLSLLAAWEAAMYYLNRQPDYLRLLPRKLRNSITYLYIQGDRKIMHFQKGSGAYSSDLGYTLHPGTFTFTEVEFSNEYRVNSLGVRDDEHSLIGPEIIFLGDSFTLGWGVDQSETFVKLLEKKTGLKTLNTSVPSYGTVREMLMLRKVDRSHLKCLILQYCDDDYDENLRYYQNGNRPQLMREETFQKMTIIHGASKRYFPGKYIRLKIRKRISEWKSKATKTASAPALSEVDAFLHVLKQNADLLAHQPLIIFELNGINQTNHFTKALQEKAKAPDQPPFIRDMIILDMKQHLKDSNFYVLDGHLNPGGHMVTTQVLYDAVLRAGLLSL